MAEQASSAFLLVRKCNQDNVMRNAIRVGTQTSKVLTREILILKIMVFVNQSKLFLVLTDQKTKQQDSFIIQTKKDVSERTSLSSHL